MQGRFYYQGDFLRGSAEDKNTSPKAIRFSPQELQVILYLSKGMSSSEIALSMGLSKRTIDSYRHNMMKKASVKNTTELLNYLNENGLK